MTTVTIDNMYETDGWSNLTMCLASIEQSETTRLVAVLPEYSHGRLDKVFVVLEDVAAPITEDEPARDYVVATLDSAADYVAAVEKIKHDAAIAALAKHPIGVIKPKEAP